MADPLYLGIDLGSITVKAVLADEAGSILFQRYQRHGAASRETLASILERCEAEHPGALVHGAVTGSAALDLPEALGLPFVQEVIASSKSIAKTAPQTDVAIELGGEDAKILYFGRSIDLRMNEACAGGTDLLGQGALGLEGDVEFASVHLVDGIVVGADMGGYKVLDLVIGDELTHAHFGVGGVVADDGEVFDSFFNKGVDKSNGIAYAEESANHYSHAVVNFVGSFFYCYEFVHDSVLLILIFMCRH